MKTSILLCPLFAFIIAGITACDGIEGVVTPEEASSVEILSIHARSTFNLSERSNWQLQLGNVFYSVNIHQNELNGTVKKGKGHRVTTGGITIFFFPSNYGRTRSDKLIPPLIGDQTTKEKLMLCDPLRGYYTGKPEETIHGIELHHYNALLSFEIKDLPGDASVYIEQPDQQKIYPLREDENSNAFKAIVLPYYKNFGLVIETGGKTYQSMLMTTVAGTRQPEMASGIGNSAILSFTAIIDKEEDKLIIENLTHQTMVKEWPVTQ